MATTNISAARRTARRLDSDDVEERRLSSTHFRDAHLLRLSGTVLRI